MKNWFLWLLIGCVSVIGGLFALFNPLSAMVTATTLAGWTLVIVGVSHGYSAWKAQGKMAKASAGLWAAAGGFMGLLLLLGPFGDGSVMEVLLAALLLLSGGAKLWSARQIKRDPLCVVVLAAGGVSIVLAAVLFLGFPRFIANNLGIVLGAELLANGAALVVLSLKRRVSGGTKAQPTRSK